MLKKGKYKLLSYIVDEHLIFYTSLNKNKKFLGFSIFETENYFPVISTLNEFLEKRFLTYYSIQIEVIGNNKIMYLLNFEDNKKDEILKFFNLIYQELNNCKTRLNFLTNDHLEKRFLSIISYDLKSNLKLLESSNSILIQNNHIKTYNINYRNLNNKKTFIHNFSKLVNNLNCRGYLIYNFKKDFDNNLIVIAYFVEVRNNNNTFVEFEREVNRFFNFDLVKKRKLNLNQLFQLLWRFELSDNSFFFKDISELFLKENQFNFQDLLEFNSQIEAKLLKNHIKYTRLNRNLILIEHKILFFTTHHLDVNLILKILKKYFSKYHIYFLVLTEGEYKKLREIKEINLLNNVVVIGPKEFLKLKIDVLKNKDFLKNTQINRNILSRVVRM